MCYKRNRPTLAFLLLLLLFCCFCITDISAQELDSHELISDSEAKVQYLSSELTLQQLPIGQQPIRQQIDASWDNNGNSSFEEMNSGNSGKHHLQSAILNADHLNQERVLNYFSRYLDDSGMRTLQDAIFRARPYRNYIINQIRKRNLPDDLFYIALIESSFVPRAMSRSGAAGLWQFVENSMAPWLEKGSNYDERLDFYRATQAALEKLAYNYSVTQDWLLTIAAYNGGLGRVSRAMQSEGVSSFWELLGTGTLSEETENYVPKFLAVAYILGNRGRFGFPMTWDNGLEWSQVLIPGGTNLSDLESALDIPNGVLIDSNPNLILGIVPPHFNHYPINVPSQWAATLLDYQWLQ